MVKGNGRDLEIGLGLDIERLRDNVVALDGFRDLVRRVYKGIDGLGMRVPGGVPG